MAMIFFGLKQRNIMPEQYQNKRQNAHLLSATVGSTFTPLLFFIPPDRGSVCNVPAMIGGVGLLVMIWS
jgi:hypothetical protein